ncbi:MAG: histidine kinase [Candidatus Omnitrophica bacterium CG11_big_fil_rev_8_21_14_0_20_42_13]|uniref:Histidine kinase n=1 Tax=Candidatus Ghiorseimicrobium undicola TaxID=1974746 RepID=A0A2H0LYC7_9BACT|nr:MAG: histidine kinase [Candidatus Omnitrophica bacterium CG11_big_fil_rev_8_21_14_0_20_42_13]
MRDKKKDTSSFSSAEKIPRNKKGAAITKVQELVYELKVGDAMHKNMITASVDTSMRQLREILRSHRISGTPIMDGDKLVGIVSIEDFIKWLAEGGKDCSIREKMTKNVKTLYADEPLVHAVSKLEQMGFGRFPVLDRQSNKLVGVITKGDIIESLLRELEVDYHEEEIHRYRASHIFEDIIADKATLTFQYSVKAKDFSRAGEVSSALRKTLNRLGIHPNIVRRAAIASYEAEMNVVIYTDGGEIVMTVRPDKIQIDVKDSGPGIADIKKAFEPGYSTAPDWVRELGFGAGMGLCNIKKCSDETVLNSTVGKGTHLKVSINMNTAER